MLPAPMAEQSIPIPGTPSELRHLIKSQGIHYWEVGAKLKRSETVLQKVCNGKMKPPEGFLERAHRAVVAIMRERHRALGGS